MHADIRAVLQNTCYDVTAGTAFTLDGNGLYIALYSSFIATHVAHAPNLFLLFPGLL